MHIASFSSVIWIRLHFHLDHQISRTATLAEITLFFMHSLTLRFMRNDIPLLIPFGMLTVSVAVVEIIPLPVQV